MPDGSYSFFPIQWLEERGNNEKILRVYSQMNTFSNPF